MEDTIQKRTYYTYLGPVGVAAPTDIVTYDSLEPTFHYNRNRKLSLLDESVVSL